MSRHLHPGQAGDGEDAGDAVEAGGYYGPEGKVMELRGYPAPAFARKITDNQAVAQRLWEESERLTGVHYLND